MIDFKNRLEHVVLHAKASESCKIPENRYRRAIRVKANIENKGPARAD
jgi:hypothetical protein